MAIKGLSIPVFGRYNYNADTGKVNYSGGIINPHAISYTAAIESTDNNPLYGDNMVIENDVGRFSTGTLTLETDDLVGEVTMFLLDAKTVERQYGEDKTVQAIVFDDRMKSPTLGTGIIEEHQIDDVNQYKAIWFKKVNYSIPEDTATTRGETIEWQTRTIEGTIARSDEAEHPWKEEAWFETESEAVEYLKAMLGVGTLGTLTVQSAAGTADGTTALTVTPEKTGTNTYRYMLGTALELPEYNADCSGMTAWDGSADIAAQTGQQVLVVEVTADGYARAAGIANVEVKGA